MVETAIHHALGLHMHQPPGNLKLLLEADAWEAEQIMRCYERAARYALEYKDVGRLHVGFSGVLLDQFRDPEVVDGYRQWVDIPAMLNAYAEADAVELIGMGHYHPIFPLIPTDDWREHLVRGREVMAELFGRAPKGFWPPEMAFCMEMIPALVEAGYEYVVVDGVHVRDGEGHEADPYKPYVASFEGASITVVPRDRAVSNAQESGLEPDWFRGEVLNKVAESPAPDAPRLMTTWSDGENGGWFRQTHEESGFFGHFFAPYMERVRAGGYPVTPTLLSDYLAAHPPTESVQVRTGAWNVASTSGYDFAQWAGSPRQKEAIEALVAVSRRYHDLAAGGAAAGPLAEARAVILEAETSCYLFWGDSWLPQLDERVRRAEALLDRAAAGGG